eukprot:8794590-Pyramimonas_sp.AAC.1
MGVGGAGAAEIDEELRGEQRRATDVRNPHSLGRFESSRGRGVIAHDGGDSNVVACAAWEDADKGP